MLNLLEESIRGKVAILRISTMSHTLSSRRDCGGCDGFFGRTGGLSRALSVIILNLLERFFKELLCGVSHKHDSVIKIHRSVDIRMKKMKYVPKAQVDWDKVKIEWVD